MGKQRERNRIKSRVDELPEEIKELLNKRLSDVHYTYTEIADEIKAKGYDISRSSVGRYALRINAVAKRLKEATEQTRIIIDTIKENRNLDAAEAADAILIDGLIKKFATAQEEIEGMPIEKAARIAVQLERTSIFREKFRLEYDRGYGDALKALKEALTEELKKEPELLNKMLALAERVSEEREDKQ